MRRPYMGWGWFYPVRSGLVLPRLVLSGAGAVTAGVTAGPACTAGVAALPPCDGYTDGASTYLLSPSLPSIPTYSSTQYFLSIYISLYPSISTPPRLVDWYKLYLLQGSSS